MPSSSLDPNNYATHPNDRGIDISLSSPGEASHVHTNGSRVSGVVTFDAKALSHYEECSIHFLGENHTIFTQTSTAASQEIHSYAKLFEFSQPLSGPQSSWPFTFEFPWHTLPVADQTVIIPHKDYEDQPGHPLPATWGFKTCYGREGSHYYLEVRAHDPSSVFHRKVRVRLPLNFVPTANVPPPHLLQPPAIAQGSLFYQSRSLDPALAVEKISLKTKIGDALHSSRVPSSAFDVQFTLPQHAYVGAPIPITLAIVHRPAESTYHEIPPVVLRGLHVRITTFSRYRVLSNHGHNVYRHSVKGKSQICTGVGYEVHLSNQGSVDLGPIIQQLRIPHDLIPTFKSYLVARSYNLKITGLFQCVDMSKEVEVEGSIDILPNEGDTTQAYEILEPEGKAEPPPYDRWAGYIASPGYVKF